MFSQYRKPEHMEGINTIIIIVVIVLTAADGLVAATAAVFIALYFI